MLVHAYYDEDPRVRREAESLVAAGRPVDVFGLRRDGDASHGVLDGVTVHRLDVRRHQGAGLGTYLVRVPRVPRPGVVGPDPGVSAGGATRSSRSTPRRTSSRSPRLPLRLVGVPILLDLHEAMPEFFRSRFPRASNPIVHRLLLLERADLDRARAGGP